MRCYICEEGKNELRRKYVCMPCFEDLMIAVRKYLRETYPEKFEQNI